MLRAPEARPNARIANAIMTAHRNAANSAKKTVIANAAAIATTVTASASASVPTVRISRAGHTNERLVYGDTILVGRSFLFNVPNCYLSDLYLRIPVSVSGC